MYFLDNKFSEKQAEKIEKVFGDLNNYKRFFKDGDFKSNKAGTKANLRLPKLGKIVSITLSKETRMDKKVKESTFISLYSKEINSLITLEVRYYSSIHVNPYIEVNSEFNPFTIGVIRDGIVDMIADMALETRIKAAMNEIACS